MSEKNMHLEDAVESKLAKAAVRVVMWIAPFFFAALSALIAWQLGQITDLQREQAKKLQQVDGAVQVLNTKLDNGVIWRITEIERRLNQVEQAQKTP